MHSLTIARVRDIDVRVHPSFLFVLVWIVYHFGISTPGGLGGIAYGLLLVALIFTCVVLHELGHCVMAQEHGVRVRNVTVFPFGGAAFIEQMPIAPRSELAITLAGPAVNVAIAVALLPLLAFFSVIHGYSSIADTFATLDDASFGGLLFYLFFANVMIFLFNLLPAFPMDGGRVLRAGLSNFLGRERATSIAVALGMAVAVLMLFVGLWMREIVLPLIAIFILIAAYGEGKAVRMEGAMRRLRVGQFALWDSGGIAEHQPIAAALRGGPRDMVVTKDGRVVGMLWRNDVLGALNGGLSGRMVSDVMDQRILSVSIDDSVYDVQHKMQATNRWAVSVTEEGIYRGIFTVDRFVHVYRYLDSHSPERRFVGFAENLTNSLRGGVR